MKVVFFGSSKFIIPVIEKLNKNFSLELVVTTEKKDADAVPFFCEKNNIPILTVSKFDNEVINRIKSAGATIAVLAYFGMLLKKDVLDIFPDGIINIHPSLLPKYRGATPVQSAIINGDHETGVSIIRLDEKMDHGPILIQKKEKIFSYDTTETLHDRLFKKGAEILSEIIQEYEAGKIIAQPQNDTKATYTKRSFMRQDGFIDSDNPPDKSQLDRMIRALHPWPGVWTVIRVKNKELRIKFLPGNFLQLEGKKPMPYKDFFNGYPELKEILLKLLSN